MTFRSLTFTITGMLPVFLLGLLGTGLLASGQELQGTGQSQSNKASLPQFLTLKDCLKFALNNQPGVNQTKIDEAVAELNKKIALGGWMPQVNGGLSYQNYFSLPTAFSTLNGAFVGVQSGVFNYATPQITVNQNIFSADALFADKLAKLNKEASAQNSVATRINLVATVSKAFYDLLLSIEQIGVYSEDTARLIHNQSDAYYRYKSGLVDKVDYKQATIALNNAMSRLKAATDVIDAKKAFLKQMMGFPGNAPLQVVFDTAQMLQETYMDTLATVHPEHRIEYQQLMLSRRIQQETTRYYRLGFLPSLSAFYNYNYEWEHNEFSKLFNEAYPYSLAGLQLNVPIFSGFRRSNAVKKSQMLTDRADWDIMNMQLVINTQYEEALASYKSSLYYLNSQRENEEMAHEVYDIVKLQYREGVKTYLDVIVAESDLQTSEISYLNALFQLLASKINLQQAAGDLPSEI